MPLLVLGVGLPWELVEELVDSALLKEVTPPIPVDTEL